MAGSKDDYGTYGSVPEVTPARNGSGASPLGISASPQDFGAQVGAAEQNQGKSDIQGSDQLSEFALKQQGMINETASTNAESMLIQKNAQVRANFLSSTGQEAVEKQQATLDAYNQNFNDIRNTLNGGAQRAFDMLGTRRLANDTSEAINYGASQLKVAHTNSLVNAVNIAQDPQVTPNDSIAQAAFKIGQAMGTTSYLHQSMIDPNNPDIVVDNDTGNHSFSDTPAGQTAKANLQANIDNSNGAIWQNAINTIAPSDPQKAMDLYTEHKDSIPPLARANIESSLAPRLSESFVQGSVNTAMGKLQSDYATMVANHMKNPSSAGSDAYNIGNVKTASGATNDTSDFQKVSSPTDGVTLAANTLRDGYQGLTLSQIGAKWAPSSENNTNDWVKNVSTSSGISPDTVPNLNDPATLQGLIRGIGTAEKSPTDRANFTNDIISQGVANSLSGAKPTMANATQNNASPLNNYPNNTDGSRVTDADYFASHREETLQSWDNWAVSQGATRAERSLIRERVNLQINQKVQDQAAQYHQENTQLIHILSGANNNGNAPTESQFYNDPDNRTLAASVAGHDIKLWESIPSIISKFQRKDTDANSPNAYDAIINALSAPNAYTAEQEAHSRLSRTDNTATNAKDYADSLKTKDLPKDDPWKTFLDTKMREIAGANGNVDGQGGQRAVDWYNLANKRRDELLQKDVSDSDISSDEGKEKYFNSNMQMPSRMQQISNAASRIIHGNGAQTPIKVTDAASYAALAHGSQYTDPNGVLRTKP